MKRSHSGKIKQHTTIEIHEAARAVGNFIGCKEHRRKRKKGQDTNQSNHINDNHRHHFGFERQLGRARGGRTQSNNPFMVTKSRNSLTYQTVQF